MALLLDVDESVTSLSNTELTKLTQSFAVVFPALETTSYHIEVAFYDTEKMHALNVKERQKDKPTDVLSFPLFLNQADWESFQQPEVLLGTIIICPEYAQEQGTPLLDLVHHGILHILGFDHETDVTTWHRLEHAIVEQAATQQLIIHGIPD